MEAEAKGQLHRGSLRGKNALLLARNLSRKFCQNK